MKKKEYITPVTEMIKAFTENLMQSGSVQSPGGSSPIGTGGSDDNEDDEGDAKFNFWEDDESWVEW